MSRHTPRKPTPFETFVRKVKGLPSRKKITPLPPILYHYTNGAGLIGILQNHELWASDSQYMNDSSEQVYATEYVVDPIVKKRLKDARDNVIVSDFLKRLVGLSTIEFHDRYLTCFCERQDLLNQWRVYGGNDGYAIGFKTTHLPGHGLGASLRKVIYAPEEQEALVKEALDLGTNFIEKSMSRMPQAAALRLAKECRDVIVRHLLEMMLAFKHPRFDVEHEWRLIATSQRGIPIHHRVGRFGITPYLKVTPVLDDATRLPIITITHGPTTTPENTKKAIRSLLRENHYDSSLIQINGIDIPMRI